METAEKFDRKEIYSHYSQKVMMLFADVCLISEEKLNQNLKEKKIPKDVAKLGADIRADIASGKKRAEYDYLKNELTIFKISKDDKDTWWTKQKDRVKVAAWIAQGGKFKEANV